MLGIRYLHQYTTKIKIKICVDVGLQYFHVSFHFSHPSLLLLSLPSLLLFGVSLEGVHEVEGSQIMAQQNAQLHGEDAVEGNATKKKTFRLVLLCYLAWTK